MANDYDGEERRGDKLTNGLILQMFEQTMSNQASQTDETKLLNQNLSDLVSEMKQRDIRDENQQKELGQLRLDFDEHVKIAGPVIARAGKTHGRLDKLWDSIFSKIGLVIVGALVVGVLYSLGVNPSDIKVS